MIFSFLGKRKKTTRQPCVLYWGNCGLESCLILLGGKLFINKDKNMATKWRLSYQKDIAGGLYPNSDHTEWRFHTIKYRLSNEV